MRQASVELDDCPVRNYTGLGDNNYAVADKEPVTIELGVASIVAYLNASPYARVFIDDCLADEAVGSYPDPRMTSVDVSL